MTLDINSMTKWQEALKEVGPRLTATDKHNQFIQYIKDQITSLGFQIVRFPFTINRCVQATRHLQNDVTGAPIPDLGPVPYSGITSQNGVVGKLRFYHAKKDSKMKGKIAVIKVTNFSLPTFLLMHKIAQYPDNARLAFSMRHPLVAATLAVDKIKAAKDSGAVAVILLWHKISEGLGQDEILPFTNDYLGIPAIWVHDHQASVLKAMNDQAVPVRLTITGSYQANVPTESFAVIVPGQRADQELFINTHTDGPNELEENGSVALLAILKAIKDDQLKFANTLVFGFTSGHFQIPQSGISGRQATSRLLQDFEKYEASHHVSARKVLGLTVEHLGGAEYTDDYKNNTVRLKSADDPMFIYTSDKANRELVGRCLTTVKPAGRYFVLRPRQTSYFGEGQPLFQAGWPTISFIAMPLALCQQPSVKTAPNINRMYEQTNLIFQILREGDRQL